MKYEINKDSFYVNEIFIEGVDDLTFSNAGSYIDNVTQSLKKSLESRNPPTTSELEIKNTFSIVRLQDLFIPIDNRYYNDILNVIFFQNRFLRIVKWMLPLLGDEQLNFVSGLLNCDHDVEIFIKIRDSEIYTYFNRFMFTTNETQKTFTGSDKLLIIRNVKITWNEKKT